MIERHNNGVRTPSESHYIESHQGEPHRSPIFVFGQSIFQLDGQLNRQIRPSIFRIKTVTFGVIGGGDRGVEKYRFFKIDPRFWHFTMKKKPHFFKTAP